MTLPAYSPALSLVLYLHDISLVGKPIYYMNDDMWITCSVPALFSQHASDQRKKTSLGVCRGEKWTIVTDHTANDLAHEK